jgi:hypothetical protein
MGQHLALVHERGGRVLGDHQARAEAGGRRQEPRQLRVAGRQQRIGAALAVGGQLGEREREVVQRQRQRLAVEVAARDDLAVVREDERIVGDRGELALECAAHVVERVRHGADHLRGAPQRVGVLHAAAVGVARHDIAAAEQLAQAGGHARLARLRAHRLESGVEGDGGALEGLERERARHDSGVEHTACVVHRERPNSGHEVGAVDERQALLGGQRQGLQPGPAQGVLAAQPLLLERGLALPHQHQPEVRQRRQVPGGTDRAAARHHRYHAAVEQGEQ